MPDITVTVDSADFQDTLDAFAKAYGYQAEVETINEKDELIKTANPQTIEDFFAFRVDAFIGDVRRSYLVTKATEAARDAANQVEAVKAKARPAGAGVKIVK